MKKLKLIYFKGCPNAEKARDAIRQAGFGIEEVLQNDLSDQHPDRQYCSPSVLEGDKLLVGSKLEGSSGGCSFTEISARVIQEKLGES